MRTKNLNLKKKIAFIASVAMIATTASYLPVGTFTASAQDVVFGTPDSKGLYVTADSQQDGTAAKIDTVDIFVKINGKYLSRRATVTNTTTNALVDTDTTARFKLTNSPDLTGTTEYVPVLANEVLNGTYNTAAAYAYAAAGQTPMLEAGADPFDVKNYGTQTGVTINSKYDVIKLKDSIAKNVAVEIPYIADATEVEFEIRAKKKSVLGKNSVTSITVPLNDHGMGKVAKQTDYVIGKSNKSNFDEDKKAFKAAADGAYEIIDLSGLVVSMTNEGGAYGNTNEAFSATGAVISEIKDGTKTYTAGGTGFDTYVDGTTPKAQGIFGFVDPHQTIDDEDDVKVDTYGVEKIGNVYAKVITTTLKSAVSPEAVIKINTGVNGNWKASGANVNSSTGILTIGMDVTKDGYAASELVTMTQGNKKEYYKFVVKNPAAALANGGTEDFGNAAAVQNVVFDVDKLKGKAATVSTQGTADGTIDSDAVFDGDYKIEREVTTEKLKKNTTGTQKDEFITKYTVYNNAKSENFTSGTSEVTITLNTTATNGNFKLATNRSGFTAAGVPNAWAGTVTTESNTSIATGANDVVTLKLSSAGTGTTAPIDWVDSTGAYVGTFVIEFKNSYEIKFDNEWLDNRADNTKDYDGTVTVTDGTNLTNPGNVDRLGFDFKGWRTNNKAAGGEASADDTYVYSVNTGSDQLEGTVITPNKELYATYEGQRYNVDLNANGGYFPTATNGGALTTYEYYAGLSAKQGTVENYSQVKRLTNNNDITTYSAGVSAGWKAVTPKKTGFVFKGWNTDANATEALTAKQLAAKFPGEGKTLTVYAVYEANDVTANFKYFPFNSNGTVETMDGRFAGTNGVGNAWITAATKTAKFAKAADGYVTFKAGEKLGDLPTPQLAGYEFEGWYAAVFSDNLTSVAATKVTADTVLDASLFADPAKFGSEAHGVGFDAANNAVIPGTSFQDGDNVYLYAKFAPKTYNITFDIGDGIWTSTKFNDPEEGELPAFVSKNNTTYVYKRADGSTLGDNDGWGNLDSTFNPSYGNNQFIGFKNWTITGSSKTYADLNAVKTAIQEMDTLQDIVIKANYESKTNSQAGIFLNANEGAIFTYDVTNKNTTTKKPNAFITSYDEFAYDNTFTVGGTTVNDYTYTVTTTDYDIKIGAKKFNVLTSAGANTVAEDVAKKVWAEYVLNTYTGDLENFEKTGVPFDAQAAGTKVSDVYKVNGEYVERANGTGYGWVVARPGYTFTGWFLDAECTQPYKFDVYPAKGTQTVVFAGWKANTTVRYNLAYDIFNGDKSEATDKDTYDYVTYAGNHLTEASNMKWIRTFMGKAGDKVSAKDLTISVKDGNGTDATYTKYVFDANLSNGLDTAEKELKCEFDPAELVNGKFEQAEPYTLIEGRFMEDGFQSSEDPETPPVSKELGTATDVKVAADGTVTFKPAANAKKYQVAKIVGSKTYYTAKFEDVTSIKVSPTKADYKVYVIAFNEDGTQSTHSVVVTGKGTGSQVALGTVMDPVATEKLEADGTKTVTISWSKAENAAWYKVFKIVNGKKYWGSKVTDTSYVLKNIPATDSYIVYVAAGDGKGHVTYGARKKVSKFPSVKNVTVAPDNKTVTFDAVEGATAYQIAKIESNNKVNYSAKSTNPTITLKNAFKAGQKYYVLAFFKDEDGKTKSSYSDTFEIK